MVACDGTGTLTSDLPLSTRGDDWKRFESCVKLSDIIVPMVVVALDTSLSENEVNPEEVEAKIVIKGEKGVR